MPVLARAVREVEAGVQRGPTTQSLRTKFQVIALLVREERTRVKTDTELAEAYRTAQLKRLDGIATILAKTAARDTSLLALLAEDAAVSDAAKRLKREMLLATGVEPPAEAEPEPEPTPGRADDRAPRGPAVGDRPAAGQPVPAARLLDGRGAPPTARPPAGQLGAHRPAAPRLRAGRRLVLHGAARAPPHPHAPGPGADAAPGPGRGRGPGRSPHLPAGRRARSRQDRPGAARGPGRRRLPAAVRRPQRRQDQLGPRGRALDAAPPGDRDPRRRRGPRRLRRHRGRQLRDARPPRRLAGRPRLPRHGRRRGALHQEQVLAALPARPAALRPDPGAHRPPADDGPDRHAADQRHRGLPRHLAVPGLDRREEAAARPHGGARGHRAEPARPRLLPRGPLQRHRAGHRAPPQDRRGQGHPGPPDRRPARRARRRAGPLDPRGRARAGPTSGQPLRHRDREPHQRSAHRRASTTTWSARSPGGSCRTRRPPPTARTSSP